MRAVLAAVVVAAVLLSGCSASVTDSAARLRSARAPVEPYFMEYRADVAPEHDASYAVPVDAGAAALQVNVDLKPKDDQLSLPRVASLTVELVAPSGEVVGSRVVDARAPAASIAIGQPPATGEYVVRVTGGGAPTVLETVATSAYYVLTVEVVYAAAP